MFQNCSQNSSHQHSLCRSIALFCVLKGSGCTTHAAFSEKNLSKSRTHTCWHSRKSCDVSLIYRRRSALLRTVVRSSYAPMRFGRRSWIHRARQNKRPSGLVLLLFILLGINALPYILMPQVGHPRASDIKIQLAGVSDETLSELAIRLLRIPSDALLGSYRTPSVNIEQHEVPGRMHLRDSTSIRSRYYVPLWTHLAPVDYIDLFQDLIQRPRISFAHQKDVFHLLHRGWQTFGKVP